MNLNLLPFVFSNWLKEDSISEIIAFASSREFDDATIFVFKGNCYDAQGNSDEALNMYKKASELDSKWEYMYQWYLNYKAK